MARVAPLATTEWPEEMRAAVAALRPEAPRHPLPQRGPGRSKGLNALGTLAHHPALTKAFNTFNGHVLFATTITPRQRELLVLRVAALRQAAYEWAQHVVLAADAGLTEAEITAVGAEGPDADLWNPLDRGLLQAADDLVTDARIGKAAWDLLAGEMDTQQLMDVVFTVGAYEVLAMMFRSFEVDLDEDLRRTTTPGGPQ